MHRGIAGGSDGPQIIARRLGGELRRDLRQREGYEFQERALFVDEAVQLALVVPAEMSPARQRADIIRNAGDLERHAVDAGVVPVGVPDEDRVARRNRIQFLARKIAALQKIVEIGTTDPLAGRRAGGDRTQFGQQLAARGEIRVADVVQELENEGGENLYDGAGR